MEYPVGLFVATDRYDGYRVARDAAAATADLYLGDRDGVAAYAVLRQGGGWAVIEDIRMIGR